MQLLTIIGQDVTSRNKILIICVKFECDGVVRVCVMFECDGVVRVYMLIMRI